MRDSIGMDEIKALDELYHKFIFRMQRGAVPNPFPNRLKDATTIEISILEIINKKPDVILKDIIQLLGVPSSTLTNAIDRLEKRNLVQRVISRRDRRSFGLELTEEGKLAQLEHKKGEEFMWRQILKPLETKEEREAFLMALKKIADSWCNGRC